ncbi:DUF411 domain-containing protein [Zwartia sp.]|uniref:DUF411 domain-containing protein n=1 Tax=Zwartia sp. TaxID=2978004 RepID=UPI0027247564|nr:DUF411 domain-containing protein [Zwartia sp.]MDO9026040.1 DUF411 domain-containing protein [Zwartia sp.]
MKQKMNVMRRGLMLAALALALPSARAAPSLTMEVWKSPTCGCCQDWVTIVEQAGIKVTVYDTGNSDIREQLGMPVTLGSCHTARIAGYAIEGHVPVREILRLLKERPEAVGLTVPGMVIGSPGMDGPEYKGQKQPYDVLLVRKNGKASVYQKYI